MNTMKRWSLKILVAVVVVAGAALVARDICTAPKIKEDRQIFPVAVAKATREGMANELVCCAEFRPYQEVDLHAKVSGYVKTIHVDVGDRVKEGQELVVLEVPELQDDLVNGEAARQRTKDEVEQAAAAFDDAHLAYTRLVQVAKSQPNLIAPQELDNSRNKDRNAQAALSAAKQHVQEAEADVSKFKTMVKYSHIVAPFEGVITKRYADLGSLIQAGTSSHTQPLVRLSQNGLLRLVFPVSISSVSRIRVGDLVDIHVESLKNTFAGKVSRFTRKVDLETRTMEAEVEVPNPKLELIPGMYASVVLKLDRREKALVVPVEAVARKSRPTVYLVNAQDRIEERVVTLGMETPYKTEITGGLKENDLVMIGARSLVRPGQKVRPKLIEAAHTE